MLLHVYHPQAFLILLEDKKEELMSDVFDLLVSLG
jgi:hypothetical protein